MCNLYDVGLSTSSKSPWEKLAQGVIAGLSKVWNIRRTDPGAIVRLVDGEPQAMVARWGFKRDFSPAINNARDDKLSGRMWSKAWRERRCLIPASAFYEWTGPKGKKQTHAIQLSAGGFMWMAGLWDESSESGLCFTTITTTPNQTMKPIHDRMPVILPNETLSDYLNRESPIDLVKPSPLALTTFMCENPLVKSYVPGPPRALLI
jgi:putative SOS response-associated peptidase YedK